MVPEASWQASSAATQRESDAPRSDAYTDQQTVEGLLHRLVERIEENERRYGEALDELHARLDRLSQTTDPAQTSASPEETETLERLRSQLSSLARRLEQPHETETGFDDFAKLGRALSEARAVAASLAAEEPGLFTPPLPAADLSSGSEPKFSFAMPPAEPSYSAPSLVLPPLRSEEEDLDKRLIEMAHRLEHSIGEAMAATAMETLNARMEDIAARFEAALGHTPKLEQLQQFERQITDMGQQLGRVEQQIARIGSIESHLQRLIERFEDAPAQMEKAASKAANEAARLVSETGLGKPSAAERLDAIHRDIVAMNEQSRVTDDRLADTLVAVHASLKDLMHQAERGRAPATPAPRGALSAEPVSGEAMRAAAVQPRSRLEPAPSHAESRAEKTLTRNDGEDLRFLNRSLRDRLGAAVPVSEDTEPMAPFGRAKRGPIAEEAVDLDEVEPSPRGASFTREVSLDSTDDFVAAARRAAQAAAARAEERGASQPRKARGLDEPHAPASSELPERRKRSVLMVVAALLLVVSAALLYSRLRSKPELETPPAPTEQSTPAPAAEIAPAPEASPELQAAPAPEPAPPTTLEPAPAPGAPPAPEAAPEAPHATTPSANDSELPPPVRVREAPTVLASAEDVALAGGVTEMTKSSIGSDAPGQAATMPKPQLASLSSSDEGTLPPGISITVGEHSPGTELGSAKPSLLPSNLPMPGAELWTLALRQAAASGDAKAQYVIAARYAQGQGSARALALIWTEAAHWFGLAASAGLAPAQYRLTVLYERGDGVTKDLGRAQAWYTRAAAQGNVKAMHNLAVAASGGRGRDADYALAAKWFAEAAAYGLVNSQFNLCILAEQGLGMPKNLTEAYKWFSLAAATGDAEAAKRRDLVKAELPAAARAGADQAINA